MLTCYDKRNQPRAIGIQLEDWQEGQHLAEQAAYSPHPLAAEAAHAEADLPNAQPVNSSVAQECQHCQWQRPAL